MSEEMSPATAYEALKEAERYRERESAARAALRVRMETPIELPYFQETRRVVLEAQTFGFDRDGRMRFLISAAIYHGQDFGRHEPFINDPAGAWPAKVLFAVAILRALLDRFAGGRSSTLPTQGEFDAAWAGLPEEIRR